jgi:hypothetical protein
VGPCFLVAKLNSACIKYLFDNIHVPLIPPFILSHEEFKTDLRWHAASGHTVQGKNRRLIDRSRFPYIQCTDLTYSVQTLHTVYGPYIQCTDLTYSVRTLHTVSGPYIQCTDLTYSVRILHTVYGPYIQCTDLTYSVQTLHTVYGTYSVRTLHSVRTLQCTDPHEGA